MEQSFEGEGRTVGRSEKAVGWVGGGGGAPRLALAKPSDQKKFCEVSGRMGFPSV